MHTELRKKTENIGRPMSNNTGVTSLRKKINSITIDLSYFEGK